MPGGRRLIGPSVPLPGSPLAALRAQVNAELADGTIPCTCPHPATASCLFLPPRILCCSDCAEGLRETADEPPLTCTLCPAPAARATAWITGPVFVAARLCEACGTNGNVPLCPN